MMTTPERLKLADIITPEDQWQILPNCLPGRIVESNLPLPGKDARYELKTLVEIRRPNGTLIERHPFHSHNIFTVGEYVLFTFTRSAGAKQSQLQVRSVKKVTEEEAVQVAEKIYATKVAELGKRFVELNASLEKAREAVAISVEQKVAERVAESEALKQGLDQRAASLQLERQRLNQEIQLRTDEAVRTREQELDAKEVLIKQRLQQIERTEHEHQLREAKIAAREEDQAHAQELFHQQGGEKFVSLLSHLESSQTRNAVVDPLLDSPPPTELLSLLRGELSVHNYTVDHRTLLQSLLSIIVGVSTGQFIVLTGPTGVGKTSMVNMMATALGAGYGVVPVRPAWIDPSDLLGFFSPQQNRFQPTPFTERLIEAARYSIANRLYLLALDEMNLSKVENYAADFLSRLEKARAGEKEAKLSLYADEIEQRLKAEVNRLRQKDDNGLEDAVMLFNHLSHFPAQMAIPDGLVILGTVNLDETTHQLSPKFLDRSFVVQITHSPLPTKIPNLNLIGMFTNPIWGLAVTVAKSLSFQTGESLKDVDVIWNDLIKWQREYLEPLGVRLGFRFPQMFRRYMCAAQNLGIKDMRAVASTFFQAKLLPWISFHKDDMAIGRDGTRKQDVLDKWAKDSGLKSYPDEYDLRKSLERMLERSAGNLFVQYLE